MGLKQPAHFEFGFKAAFCVWLRDTAEPVDGGLLADTGQDIREPDAPAFVHDDIAKGDDPHADFVSERCAHDKVRSVLTIVTRRQPDKDIAIKGGFQRFHHL